MLRPSQSYRRPGQSRPDASILATLRSGNRHTAIVVGVLTALLLICALGGGSAFPDTLSLLFIRPAAVIALVVLMLVPARADWAPVRAPLAMLAALAAIMLVQLIPLPPSAWLALPGRAPYAQAALAVGIPQPWRPLSLTPDLTANSLAALVLPAAILVGFAKLEREQRCWLAGGLAILCCASAALGVAQFAGGKGSPLFLYKRTHDGFPVGLLANRNHQAALLALTFPALRFWSLRPVADRAAARRKQWLALALGALVVPVVLATGSRAGMVITAASMAATFAIRVPRTRTDGEMRAARLIRLGVPAALTLAVLASYALGRAVSIERLTSVAAMENDQRVQFAPTVVDVIRRTFPAGTGFGSFDAVFRQYEPDTILIPGYFNHAHNEVLELAMTAGLPGMLLLIVFLAWWGWRMTIAFRAPEYDEHRRFQLLGGLVVAVLLAASLVDYPLRTPLMSALFALGCGWLSTRPARAR